MPRTWQVAFAHLSQHTDHEDAPIAEAQDWLHRHDAEEVSIEGLAAMVGMSPRNFARRFKSATSQSPLNYLHALRIETAKRLLENGRLTVQEIMLETGYEDGIFFRKLFCRRRSWWLLYLGRRRLSSSRQNIVPGFNILAEKIIYDLIYLIHNHTPENRIEA